MKQTDVCVGGVQFWSNYFSLHISIFAKKKHTLKMSAKFAQQSMILTYQIFCVPNPWSLQGSHDSLLPSISKHWEKITILTDQIIHTLKNEFVYFCM